MGKIIGIDLGTTNSVVAVMEGGEPTASSPAPRARASRRRSSASPRAASGWSARSPSARPSPTRRTRCSRSSASWAAAGMTRRSSARRTWCPTPSRRTKSDGMIVTLANGKSYSPPEISAMILQKLKSDAEAYSGREGDRGGHHRPGLLRRHAAPGDQGRRPGSPASTSSGS